MPDHIFCLFYFRQMVDCVLEEQTLNRRYFPIFFFSGTGNTWWIASRLADALIARGYTADARSIEQLTESQVAAQIEMAEMVGIGYPIYGSDAPLIMQEFIKALPAVEKPKKMLIFVTQAVWSGDGAYFLRHQIEEKGYQIRWAVHFNMPGNISLDCGAVLNLFFKSMTAEPQKALKRVNRLAQRVVQNRRWIMGSSQIFSLGWIQRFPFRKSLSYWQSGVLSVDPERCNACERCEQLCPVGNILMEGGLPQYGDNCNLCLRCFNYCPQLAVLYFGKPFNHRWYGEKPYQGPTPDFEPEQLIGK